MTKPNQTKDSYYGKQRIQVHAIILLLLHIQYTLRQPKKLCRCVQNQLFLLLLSLLHVYIDFFKGHTLWHIEMMWKWNVRTPARSFSVYFFFSSHHFSVGVLPLLKGIICYSLDGLREITLLKIRYTHQHPIVWCEKHKIQTYFQRCGVTHLYFIFLFKYNSNALWFHVLACACVRTPSNEKQKRVKNSFFLHLHSDRFE